MAQSSYIPNFCLALPDTVQEPAAVTAYDTVVTPDGNIILEYRDIVSDGDKIQVDLPTSDLKQHGDPLVPNGLSLVTTANQEIADASQDISFTSGEIMNLKIDQPTQSIVSTGVTGVQLDGLMLNTTGVQSTIQVSHGYPVRDTHFKNIDIRQDIYLPMKICVLVRINRQAEHVHNSDL